MGPYYLPLNLTVLERHQKLIVIYFSQYFNNKTVSVWFLFLSQTHGPPLLHTVFVCDLASGWAGSSGKQNKAIWFLRPYAAPTLNNRPGKPPCPSPSPSPSTALSESLPSACPR